MANNLPTEKKITATAMLCEGSSIRSIERVTGIHRDTIMRLGVRMGEGCRKIMDEKLRNLPCKNIQIDEAWGFIEMKQRTLKQRDLWNQPKHAGDVWVWVAIDADSKLVPTVVTGGRTMEMAQAFTDDLASRLSNRIQLSSDALSLYEDAVYESFGSSGIDYGSIVKTFSHTSLTEQRRYSPPEVLRIKKERKRGQPDFKLISTSFVEKQNHTLRMHCRRLSRLTNAFSKKFENFQAAVALNYGYYNFVKRHITVKTAPAVAAGVIDSPWSVADLVEMIEA